MLKRQLLMMLVTLMLIFIALQFYLFVTHYKISSLMDTLISASIFLDLFHPVILLPIAGFILIHILAYALLICWIWFVSMSIGAWFKLSNRLVMCLGLFIWFLIVFSLFTFNQYYFPDSLFSRLFISITSLRFVSLSLLVILTLFSWFYSLTQRKFLKSGSILLFSLMGLFILPLVKLNADNKLTAHQKPNIIIIGIDSLRPDYTGFYGNQQVSTPNLDNFLASAVSFSESYTPLARTFPSWISILTGKYPKNNHARNNLIDASSVIREETLAKKLQQAGYATIYATDEKRFSNITNDYGFDRILGPKMGVNDFLLGSLSDFPLSNLLVNSPAGKFLFPYHFGNRAATVTYQPDKFLQLIKEGLTDLPDKPVFLSVHLCLSHWPHKWADKNNPASNYLTMQYIRSINAVDDQFRGLMQLLKSRGFLENAWVILLSDHGTALGLPNDRIISEEKYRGDAKKIKLIKKLKSVSLPNQNNQPVYTINTSYGQGTNVLSLTQNHVVLAFKRYGDNLPARQVNVFASLIDVAPTILDLLSLSSLKYADGISLRENIYSNKKLSRIFFMETGDSFSAIETDQIYVDKVVRHEIGIYGVNPVNGLLTMHPLASQSILKNKQLAVWQGNWILAYYPARKGKRKIIPSHFVLANVKTGEWTVGLDSAFAKKAPTNKLQENLRRFYEEDLIIKK